MKFNRKLLIQIGSFILSVIVIAMLINIQLSIVIMTGILIHELGHLYIAKRYKYYIDGLYFIPILGGFTRYRVRNVETAEKKFIISIMGPVFGAVLSGILLIAYLITSIKCFAQAAEINAFLNIFNIIPYTRSDGFFMLQSITSRIKSYKNRLIIFSIALAFSILIIALSGLYVVAGMVIALSIMTLFSFKDNQNLAQPPSKKLARVMTSSYAGLVLSLIFIVFYCSSKEDLASMFAPWNG